VGVEKIFDGRLIFRCSKCSICSIVAASSSPDESYLDFLDRYDKRSGVAESGDLKLLMEQEKIIRSSAEMDALLRDNGASGDPLLEDVLRSQQDYVVDFRVIEEPPPDPGNDIHSLPVDDALVQVLALKKIERLYMFQEEAIKSVLQGKDVVITAPTASGKTEAFCIPILQKISEEVPRFGSLRPAKGGKILAIFVYPTKSLSRDQLPKILELAEPLGIRAALLDGDTPERDRSIVLESPPEIIITNFDVIHYHMMHRTKFSRLLRTAKFLVVDEAHVYTGVFGANIHHVIKRLERFTGRLQVVAASATLPNASEFCDMLFGRQMHVIKGKGRRGRINFAMIFPSLRSNRSLSLDLLKQTTKRKHQTIAFSGSHLGSELTAFYAARQGVSVRVHRAGLAPAIRKDVEQQFKSRKLAAISATPTLELGIDIGDVDAIISNIVPINRLIQRVGRAARRGQKGYAFLALGNDPISQYYKQHPADYLADHEYAYTDPTNPFVLDYQVLAMVCDRPLSVSDSKPVWNTVQGLISKGLVKAIGEKFTANLKEAMQVLNEYSIRGIGTRVDIKFNNKIVGDRALPQALEELHQNAIYFLAGRRYRVKELHFDRSKGGQPYAELEQIPSDYPYYTKPLTDEWPSILETYEKRKIFGIQVAYCSLKIKKQVMGYANIEIGQEVAQGKKVMLEKPIEYEFVTKGFVFRAPRPLRILEGVEDENYVETSSYHATEHVVIEGSAMITGGASQDLGGISLGSSGLIFVYDGSIGGNGASRALFDRLDKAFGRTLRILSECPCTNESGCPRCTYSYRCGNNNEYLHKKAATEVVSRIIEGEQTEIGEQIWGDRALV
jgi:DEAD/DEAH box helicase domain-containing protein